MCGRIGAVFFKSLHVTPMGIFIHGGILIELLAFCLIDQTAGRNKFYVDLYLLSWIRHLLIGLRDILGVGEFFRHDSLFLKEAVESGNGTLISPLHELDPENNQSGMGIAPAHILNQLDFFRGMLVWMGMGTSGTVMQGVP